MWYLQPTGGLAVVIRGSGSEVAKPRARTDLVVRGVGDEIVLYDPVSHLAHCLNRDAARVFRAANGTASSEAIASRLTAETGLAHDAAVIDSTIERFLAAGLLESAPETPANPSRRVALRK